MKVCFTVYWLLQTVLLVFIIRKIYLEINISFVLIVIDTVCYVQGHCAYSACTVLRFTLF